MLVIDDGAIDTLVTGGAEVGDDEIAGRRALASLSDVATIIYTSGTTGRPKGVELTHGNFYELTVNAVADLHEVFSEPGARTLLFMPLAHVFARFIEVLCIPAGAVLGHSPSTVTLIEDLGTFRPTFILAVPRVFEKVYNSAEQKAAAGGKGAIFQRAAKTSIVYSRALDNPRGPSPWLRLQHKVADALVLHKLRNALGGQARWAVSGGAPLGERLGHFYRGLGLNVLEGYGLTETTAPATVNRPGRGTKIGTVGLPLPGSGVRIAADGEIELQGVQVFRGYHNNDAATAEAVHDGWFRTGDLGSLDDDGYLRITGRKKEIIVTAGGKNVAPAVLEDRIRAHPLVSQVVVVGDQRPFIGALITLDPEGVPGLARRAREAGDDARGGQQGRRRPGVARQGRREGQQGRVPRRVGAQVPDPRHGPHHRQRLPHAEAQHPAQRGAEGLRGRGRRAVRGPCAGLTAHTARTRRRGGTRPDAASTPMACCSAASSSTAPAAVPAPQSAGGGAGADARTGMVRNVTTQSAHAVARAVQVSQSMIMRRTLATTTDNGVRAAAAGPPACSTAPPRRPRSPRPGRPPGRW